jgi:PBSX family phage terminase large subunit
MDSQNEHEESRFRITPTPKQTEFVTNTAKFSCFSGGYGNGKTFAGCMRALTLSQYPKNYGLIGRLNYPELRDTTRRSFFELCPPEYYEPENGGEWRVSENKLKLINGSEIIFRHLDTTSEKELLSLNLGWFFIDQAEEISESVFMVLQSRLRLNHVPNRYGFLACNPEPGNWIYHRFKKPKDEGTLTKEYSMVEAATWENQENLPADYIQTLRDSYPEAMQKRYIDGEWEVFEGQIYSEFVRNIHAIKPFEIPKGWERLIAIDHGMVNPTAALWGAIDFDGNIFIYDEYYQPGVVSQHAKFILEKTGEDLEHIAFWLIDPSTRARTREKDGMPWSVLEEYEDHGIYATPANNELLGGINRVREFLRVDPNRKHPVTSTNGSPKLFIFSNCVNLISEFPQYQWKKLRSATPRNAPERPRDFNDHALDALRYMIMSRFPAPVKKATGYELVLPEQRRKANEMGKPFAENYKGDSMLGKFSGVGGVQYEGGDF